MTLPLKRPQGTETADDIGSYCKLEVINEASKGFSAPQKCIVRVWFLKLFFFLVEINSFLKRHTLKTAFCKFSLQCACS